MMTAAMAAAAMTFAVMVVMVAAHIGIEVQRACQEQGNRFVSITTDTAEELDAGLAQCHLGATTDAAADQYICLQIVQKSSQCAVTAAVGINDLRIHNHAVLDFVNLKLGGVAKMLEDKTIFISNCDFHFLFSFGVWWFYYSSFWQISNKKKSFPVGGRCDKLWARGECMYSDVFCKVYNEFGWNYYPEIFGEQLLKWLEAKQYHPKTAMDLACGTGILCRILHEAGIEAAGMDFSSGMIDIARENNPTLSFDVADMTTYRPAKHYDLVTCTGDAVNHIPELTDVEKIFANVYAYLAPGGWFVFDLLNENEVSDSEPFEMDFTESTKVWFQMTRPAANKVNLKIKVYENGKLDFEENIRETIHDPLTICKLLENCGFRDVVCQDRLLPENNPGTTWFVTGRK